MLIWLYFSFRRKIEKAALLAVNTVNSVDILILIPPIEFVIFVFFCFMYFFISLHMYVYVTNTLLESMSAVYLLA